MEIIVKRQLQVIFEAYNIFVNDEKVAKVRGKKEKITLYFITFYRAFKEGYFELVEE